MELFFHLHFVHRAVVATILTGIECAITFILVFLRVYGRSIGVLRLKIDFWLVSFALILATVTLVVSIPAYRAGVGWHEVDITYPELFACLEYVWIALPIGLAAIMIGKLAIVALLLGVTTILQPYRRIFLITIGVINTAVGIAETVVMLTQCDPYPYLWARYIPGGSCPRAAFAADFSYFQGAVTGLTDIILALYPVSIVWNMTVSRKTKVGFCALMAGGLVCVVSPIMRSRSVRALVDPKDATYELPYLFIWATTEMWLILIIASIPQLRPLFLHWFWNEARRSRQNGSKEPQFLNDARLPGDITVDDVEKLKAHAETHVAPAGAMLMVTVPSGTLSSVMGREEEV